MLSIGTGELGLPTAHGIRSRWQSLKVFSQSTKVTFSSTHLGELVQTLDLRHLSHHPLAIVPRVLRPEVVKVVLVVLLCLELMGGVSTNCRTQIGRVEDRRGAVAIDLGDRLVHPALRRRVVVLAVGSGLPPGPELGPAALLEQLHPRFRVRILVGACVENRT